MVCPAQWRSVVKELPEHHDFFQYQALRCWPFHELENRLLGWPRSPMGLWCELRNVVLDM